MELFKFKILMLLILSVYGMEIQNQNVLNPQEQGWMSRIFKNVRNVLEEIVGGLGNSAYATTNVDCFQNIQAKMWKWFFDRIQWHRKSTMQKCLLQALDEEMNMQETSTKKFQEMLQAMFDSEEYQNAFFPDPTNEEKNSKVIEICINCLYWVNKKYLSYFDHLKDTTLTINQHHYVLCPECKRDNINDINKMKKCPYCNDKNALHTECQAMQDIETDCNTCEVFYDGTSFATVISLWSLFTISYLTFRRIKLDVYDQDGETAGGEFEVSLLFNSYEVVRDALAYYAMCGTAFFIKNRHQNSLLINLKGLMQLSLPIIAGLLTYFDFLDYSALFMVFTIVILTVDLILRKWGPRNRYRTTSNNFSNFMAAYPHAYFLRINEHTVKYMTKTPSWMQTLSMAENVAYYWILMGAIAAPIVNPSKSYILYQAVATFGFNGASALAAVKTGTTYTPFVAGPLTTYATMGFNALVAAGIFGYRMKSKIKQNVPVFNFNQIAQIMFSTFVVLHGSPELYIWLFRSNMIFLFVWIFTMCMSMCCGDSN